MKRRLQQFVAAATSLTSCYLAAVRAYTDMRPTVLLWRVFVAAGMCLPSRFLATKEWIRFTEPLPRNDRSDTHTNTQAVGRELQSGPPRLA
jgi:hypothetical protein